MNGRNVGSWFLATRLHQPKRDHWSGTRQQGLPCRVQICRDPGIVAEPAEPEWPHEKITGILNSMKQGHLFEDQSLEDFRIMPKLPYRFSYRFKDDAGVESKLMIEDWEIGQLYWNCEKRYGKDQAVQKVRQKYMDDFVKTKDLYLFLGTTYEWHVRKARNPFVIIGTFHPPHITQNPLF